MERKRKKCLLRGVCLVLASLMPAGCGTGQSNHKIIYESGETVEAEKKVRETPKGRYIEQELALPEGFFPTSVCSLPDGSILLTDVGQSGQTAVSEDGGNTWNVEQNHFCQELNVRGMKTVAMTVTSEGEMLISYEDRSARKNDRFGFAYMDAAETISYPEICFDTKEEYAKELISVNTGEIFALTNLGGIYEVSPDTETAKCCMTIGNMERGGLYRNGDSVVALDDGKVYFYQKETGRVAVPDMVLNGFCREEEEVVLYGNGDGRIYVACEDGIYSHGFGGNLMEQMADGELTKLGDASKIPRELIVQADGTIFILYEDGELASYIYDEEMPSIPDSCIKESF